MTTEAPHEHYDAAHPDPGDEGYEKGLSKRQVTMIAIGGAIGVGLFLGAGGRMASSGPALVLSYAACGVIAFLLMRALGELVIYRTSSGSFVSYAREFYGHKFAYVAGWMYILNWMATGIAEITAVATYVLRWAPDLPQWIPALIALVVVVAVNMMSVKAFGEFEFWAALLKVTALVAFLVIGIGLVATSAQIGGHEAGVGNLVNNGGFFPEGWLAPLLVTQGVIFAYASIELVGIAAGETKNPEQVIPRAVNAVVYRIAIFYVGSVLLLAMLLPYTEYQAGESPFVTVFGRLGIPWIGDAMNVIVLTAALSSCNSGLYSTGRILRSLAADGEAPAFTAKMNRNHVPYGGILLVASVYVLGVVLNYFVPSSAFEIALSVAALGVIWTWAVIFLCQLRLRRQINSGELEPTKFPMPGYPWTAWVGLISLAGIVGLMALTHDGRLVLALGPLIALVLVAGWYIGPRRFRRGLDDHALFEQSTGGADSAGRPV
jgi:L-asparagine permease